MRRVIRRVLVANRGEIAVRVVRACHELGLEAVVAVSTADRDSLAARHADEVVCIGPPPAAGSYLRRDAIVAAALGTRVDAVHPGYGFLAEDAAFARLCEDNGVRFIGPRPEILELFGDKVRARAEARSAGVPLGASSGVLTDADDAVATAASLGYPVVLKAVRGGGGKGMRVARSEKDVRAAFGPASAEAAGAFGDGSLYAERFLARARHVEVQVAGDGTGRAIHLGDRDCSVQRKHQKLVEEAPAPGLPADVQQEIREAAVRLAQRVGYESVGTVEFVVDPDRGEVSFLEVNARLQVEHGVTEEVTGVDLVKLQLGLADASGEGLPDAPVPTHGVAIECRLNAEDPTAGFRPSPGEITQWRPPAGPGIRVDSHCFAGYMVPPYYDSLLAKLMCRAETRDSAIEATLDALSRFVIDGVHTTCGLLETVVDSAAFRSCAHSTTWLEDLLDRTPDGRLIAHG